jgi:hypothetical protein
MSTPDSQPLLHEQDGPDGEMGLVAGYDCAPVDAAERCATGDPVHRGIPEEGAAKKLRDETLSDRESEKVGDLVGREQQEDAQQPATCRTRRHDRTHPSLAHVIHRPRRALMIAQWSPAHVRAAHGRIASQARECGLDDPPQ